MSPTNELKRVGQMMSNVCYNLARVDKLTDDHRRVMRKCVREWDAAVDACRPAVRARPTKKGSRK